MTTQIEEHLGENAVMGTNTSTLPITGLAKASKRPANFIGIHFFSPVERMGLVEIIMGKETTQETLAKTMDYVLKIKKTPVAVNDFRGFYTSRVFGTYPEEGMTMLAEGIAPAIIENVGRMAGMPMGPLEVSDLVGIDTMLKIGRESAKVAGHVLRAEPGGRSRRLDRRSAGPRRPQGRQGLLRLQRSRQAFAPLSGHRARRSRSRSRNARPR